MRVWVFSLLVLTLFAAFGIDMAFADAEIYCDTKELFEGPIGTIIGTMVSLAGLLTFLKGGGFAGIIMMIAGAIVLLAPQLLTSVLTGMDSGISGTKRDTSGNYDYNVNCGN